MSDMIDEDDEDALYMSMSFETKMVRLVGSHVMPARLKIRADVSPEPEMSEADVSAALMKIRFFFDNIISKVVAFSYDNEDALGILINEEGKNRTSNVLMITPGDPTDEVLSTLFQAKMEALSGNRISFGLIEIKSDNHHGLAFTFVGESKRMLPTMEQWIGKRSFFDEPWWNRDDASTLDVIPAPDADLKQKPAWAFSLDGIGAVAKASDVEVVRPQFRPTVIDGGK